MRGLGQHVQEFELGELLTFYDASWLELGQSTPEKPEFRKALSHEQAIEMAASRLYSTCYQFWPEVILIVSGMFISSFMLEVLRSRGHKIVMLHTESPYEDGVQLERAVRCDISLVNDPLNLAAFKKASKKAEYMPHAYRPTIHHPGPSHPDYACDFSFIGTGFASRIEFFEQMNWDGIDALFAGEWHQVDDGSKLREFILDVDMLVGDAPPGKVACLDNDKTAQVYRSSKVGMNFYRREHDSGGSFATSQGIAMGPREVEMAACGLPFLRDPRPESDQVLGMLPSFTSPQEASEKLRWLLDRPAVRDRLGEQARAAVAGRTFDAGARRLMKLLETL